MVSRYFLLTLRIELGVVLQQELRQRRIVEIGKHGLSSVKRPNGVKIFGGKFKVINREVLYETFAVHPATSKRSSFLCLLPSATDWHYAQTMASSVTCRYCKIL